MSDNLVRVHTRTVFRKREMRNGRISDLHGALQRETRDDLHGGRFATCYL